MKKQKKAFTLVELIISITILVIIILGTSLSFVKISDNFYESNLNFNIFNEVEDFLSDTNQINYSSGIVYTGGILLHNNKNGFLIGSFLDGSGGYNYTFDYNDDKYDEYHLGYFILNQNTLSLILNNSLNINNLKYNNGKVYNKLIIKDLDIVEYNSGEILELNIDFFKNYKSEYTGKYKTGFLITPKEYIKLNFNF